MDSLAYEIPVIKGKASSSDEGKVIDRISQLPKKEALKALFPYLTPSQIEDLEDLAIEFKPVVFQPRSNVLDFEKPDDRLFDTYLTEMNGGNPLRVVISRDGVVSVYSLPKDFDWRKDGDDEYQLEEYPEMYYTELMKEYRPKKIFLGESVDYKHSEFWPGNTILLELEPGKYASLDVDIEEFEIDDEILHYYSPVGNNAVPYPVGVGKKYVYMIDYLKYFPIRVYNEDVPEKNLSGDFWHILDGNSEGKSLKITKRIRNKRWR